LYGGSARRKAITYTGHIHALSGIRTHNTSVRLKTVRALDRAAIGTGKSKFGLGPLACYDSEFDF